MEDEEDIFVGDMVTCVVRVVRENELKEGVTAKQVLAGEMPEEEEEEEEEKEEKTMLTAEEFEKLASEAEKPERAQFERGVVYSKRWGMRGSNESQIPVQDPRALVRATVGRGRQVRAGLRAAAPAGPADGGAHLRAAPGEGGEGVLPPALYVPVLRWTGLHGAGGDEGATGEREAEGGDQPEGFGPGQEEGPD